MLEVASAYLSVTDAADIEQREATVGPYSRRGQCYGSGR
jgi:hypothetical protein